MGSDQFPAGSELLSVRTGDIVPVDLNSFLCGAAAVLARVYTMLERPDLAQLYTQRREEFREGIRAVLFNEKDGLWYDYNTETNQSNRQFYPSNLSPLYTQCHHADLNTNLTLETLLSSPALNYSGQAQNRIHNKTAFGPTNEN